MSQHVDSTDLRKLLDRALSAEARRLLELAVRVAAEHATPIYLVGGPVRDALLANAITDLDLVTEGDAWPIAEAYESLVGGRLTRHAAFRTAAVEVAVAGQPFVIDFVTARRETYAAPAALPTITPSHIHDDLSRRDFTINTLALRLEPSGALELLDPFGGLDDLRRGALRVLHESSFEDDPTRILRAARFAERLTFQPDEWTRGLIDAAIRARMIDRTTPQRMLHEVWLALREPQPERALRILSDWGAFPQLRLVWSNELPAQFAAARAALLSDVTLAELYLGLLIVAMSQEECATFAARYNLPAWARTLVAEVPQAMKIPPDEIADDATLESHVQRFSLPTLRTIQLAGQPSMRVRIARYVDHVRALPPLVSGDDLKLRGLAPGAAFGTILRGARRAQLRGEITTRESALRWLDALLRDSGSRTWYDQSSHSEV